MTTNPDPASDGEERVQPVALFTRNCQALWATTYSVDLALLNEFLFPQLGDPPVNLSVLVDHDRLAETLSRTRDADALAAVNRDWLLRGVGHGAGAFHPKSYLAVSGSQATLLIGSGNLTTDGLGAGKEVFTRFATGEPTGDAAVATWIEWVGRLVAAQDDPRLAERFADLRSRLPQLDTIGASPDVAVLHTLDTPLATQLQGRAGTRIDELLLTAPFYDEHAEAAGALVDALAPTRVQVWAAADTSVDGAALRTQLRRTGAEVQVWRYSPHRFVHAKLIGVVAGSDGWLLSGSANLSHAALTLAPEAGGNLELAVCARLPTERIHSAFTPPDTDVEPWPADELDQLTFTTPVPDDVDAGVRLHSAELDDTTLRLHTNPPFDADEHADWQVTDGDVQASLEASARAADEAIAPWPHPSRLVWLADDQGDVLSNPVVVDDPVALAQALTARDAERTSDRPAELTLSDTHTPLGELLELFHRHIIMDVSDTTALSPAQATEQEADPAGDDELWDRLAREQLAHDPRTAVYRAPGWEAHGSGDPIIDLLTMLRERAPSQNASPLTAMVTFLNEAAARWHEPDSEQEATEEDEASPPRRRWSLATRVRVRARNVLRRWAAAQSDTQLQWVDPAAPIKNLHFALVLLGGLYQLRRNDDANPDQPLTCPLSSEDLEDLTYRWLAAVIGTGDGDSWLEAVDSDTRVAGIAALPDTLPGHAAGLCWLALRPGKGARERSIRWQPLINSALYAGLLEPSDATIELIEAATGRPVDQGDVIERLLECAEFIDDDLWCDHTARKLGLADLRLERLPADTLGIRTKLIVDGITEPLDDPRSVRLVAEAQAYRRGAGTQLYAADGTWRLVLPDNDQASFLPQPRVEMQLSVHIIDADIVDALQAEGRIFREQFPNAAAA